MIGASVLRALLVPIYPLRCVAPVVSTAVCGIFYRLPLCTVHPCLGCVIVCDACIAKLNASAASVNYGHCAEKKSHRGF